MTAHGGPVVATGPRTVMIGGLPAATVGDLPTCTLPPPAAHPPAPFVKGSLTVFINGKPALRMGDVSGCGAAILAGAPNVHIGG